MTTAAIFEKLASGTIVFAKDRFTKNLKFGHLNSLDGEIQWLGKHFFAVAIEEFCSLTDALFITAVHLAGDLWHAQISPPTHQIKIPTFRHTIGTNQIKGHMRIFRCTDFNDVVEWDFPQNIFASALAFNNLKKVKNFSRGLRTAVEDYYLCDFCGFGRHDLYAEITKQIKAADFDTQRRTLIKLFYIWICYEEDPYVLLKGSDVLSDPPAQFKKVFNIYESYVMIEMTNETRQVLLAMIQLDYVDYWVEMACEHRDMLVMNEEHKRALCNIQRALSQDMCPLQRTILGARYYTYIYI